MDPIYVTGHRNPDTDSIVSAISYAALRNSLGDREFTAARLGHISDETQRILERFEFQPPALISTMRTQVRDLDFDQPPALNAGVTISRAWEALMAPIPAPDVVVADGGTGFAKAARAVWPGTRVQRCVAYRNKSVYGIGALTQVSAPFSRV